MSTSRRISLVSLLVSNYDDAVSFYVDKVGFSLKEDTKMGNDKRRVIVSLGNGTDLILSRVDENNTSLGNQGGGKVWMFLNTDDFMSDYNRMKTAGVKFLEEPRHEKYGSVAVF